MVAVAMLLWGGEIRCMSGLSLVRKERCRGTSASEFWNRM